MLRKTKKNQFVLSFFFVLVFFFSFSEKVSASVNLYYFFRIQENQADSNYYLGRGPYIDSKSCKIDKDSEGAKTTECFTVSMDLTKYYAGTAYAIQGPFDTKDECFKKYSINCFKEAKSSEDDLIADATNRSKEVLALAALNGSSDNSSGSSNNSSNSDNDNRCVDKYSDASCVDINSYSEGEPHECFKGLCPGAANIQCCRDISPTSGDSNSTAKSSRTASRTAPGVSSSGATTRFTNPLTVNSAEGLLGNIMGAVQKIIVTLALVTIIIGALMYVSSGVNSDLVKKAKETISAALIGLALAVAAPSLLKELAGILGWNSNNSTVNNSLTLSAIALNVLNFLLGLFGIVSLVMMIIGASLYLTSAGDQDRIDKGKDIFKYSLLGIIVAMSAMILIRQIAAFFLA